jgi:hypothetical protein
VIDATFFALTGLALPILRHRDPATRHGPVWINVVALAFATLQLLAIAGSLLQQNMRVVALTGLGWIAAAAVVWALFFARKASVDATRRDVA